MVKLAEYKRSATFAWSHDRTPALVTGTAAGTVDADFSSDSKLELWSLLSGTPDKPLCSLTTDSRFNDLDWSPDGKFIAGAMDSGAVEIFGTNQERSALHSFAKHNNHSNAATTVRFNPKQANLLLSGGSSNGEIFIWDTTKCVAPGAAYQPVLPGNAKTALDEIKSLAWNNAMAQVFASAGNTTYASIWDLKAKREVLHLDYTNPDTGARAQFAVVEWHPTSSTKVATASGNDADPIVAVWDLREANKPLQVLSGGHSKGIMSMDWCAHDDSLMLTSGRDNSVQLWNPEDGQLLSQFPPRSNWCFKTQFAPEAPDIFAAASFDGRVQVQTLQSIETAQDKLQGEAKSAESESEFWNNVTEAAAEGESTETQRPAVVLHLQAPKWYGTQCPAANWAFGGKLVSILPDGKSVSVTKPVIQGMEPNEILNDAFKTKDFVPLINVRLAKATDKNNEDDWGLLEKLSMDGRAEFLNDAFALDDESEVEEKESEDGAKFFSKMETAFTPQGSFKLEGKTEQDISRDLIKGRLDSAVSKCIDNDMLLEALVIALDSTDPTVKEIVKNVYFSKNANKNALSRVMYNTQRDDIDDMVDNMDIQQWKYIVKAIYSHKDTARDALLIKLGERLLASDLRQDALVLFFAAGSLDKVASIWLKEFNAMEDSLKAANKTVYEAHSECLTEFIEKFTVLSSFLGGNLAINSDELIAKFLEFVSLTSASGNFDLAAAFLENLPGDNEEVNTEKERVQIASGKRVGSATRTQQQTRTRPAHNNYMAQPAQPAPFGMPTPASSAPGPQPLPLPQTVPAQVPSGNRAMAGKYAPAVPAATAAPVAPVASAPVGQFGQSQMNQPQQQQQQQQQQPMSSFVQPSQSFVQPANPYTPVGSSASPVGAFGQPQQSNNAMAPPPQTGMASGQTPHLNRKANDGWNDLPLSVEKKQGRAKAVSVAPVNVGMAPGSVNGSPQIAGGNMPPPPLSRMASSASIPPPMGRSRKASQAGLPTPETALPPVPKMPNPYAPQEVTTPVAAASPQFPPMGNVPTPVNPYAPPPAAQNGAAPGGNVSNPYAPPPQAVAELSTPSRAGPYVPSRDATPHSSTAAAKKMNSAYAPQTQNPYAPAQPSAMGGVPATMTPPTSFAPPPMNRGQNNSVQHSPLQQPVGPPPMNMKRKPHTAGNAEDASNFLDSMKRNAPPQAATSIPSAPVAATPPPIAAPAQAAPPPAAATPAAAPEPMSADVQEMVEFLKSELGRVGPLIPQEYAKQLKDCQKRLNILFGHLERGDLLTEPTIAKLKELVEFLKTHDYKEAMRVHVDIATNHPQEGGNWLTGVKRLINIAEATSN